MRSEFRHCGSCGGERPFETPPCADGHGTDCPERVCTECGTAILVDPPVDPAGAAPATAAIPHRTNAA